MLGVVALVGAGRERASMGVGKRSSDLDEVKMAGRRNTLALATTTASKTPRRTGDDAASDGDDEEVGTRHKGIVLL